MLILLLLLLAGDGKKVCMKMTEILFRYFMLLSCCTGVFYLSCANSLNEKNPSACESLANALGVDYGKETTGSSGDESAAEDYKTKITTGADVPDDAWVWGRIAPSGYVVLSFSAKEDKAYRIFWNDSANGTDEYSAENGGCQVNIKGTFGSDPTLSGHYWYSESKNEYWTFDTSSGYTEGGKISAKEKVSVARDRTVWLRIGLAENSPDGCFSIAVLENDEPVSLSEERVFGATTNAVTSLASPLSSAPLNCSCAFLSPNAHFPSHPASASLYQPLPASVPVSPSLPSHHPT